jgi:hypothetical protein
MRVTSLSHARALRPLLQSTNLAKVGPDKDWWGSVQILLRFEDDLCVYQ